jgi:hypothetical protein
VALLGLVVKETARLFRRVTLSSGRTSYLVSMGRKLEFALRRLYGLLDAWESETGLVIVVQGSRIRDGIVLLRRESRMVYLLRIGKPGRCSKRGVWDFSLALVEVRCCFVC